MGISPWELWLGSHTHRERVYWEALARKQASERSSDLTDSVIHKSKELLINSSLAPDSSRKNKMEYNVFCFDCFWFFSTLPSWGLP